MVESSRIFVQLVSMFSQQMLLRDNHSYFRLSGTSLSTPIIAGLAALVMEAHPEWTAQQVRTAIKMTASHATSPDNDYGWGVANGPAAVDYVFSPVSGTHQAIVNSPLVISAYPNPANSSVTIQLNIPENGQGEFRIFDINGRLVRSYPRTQWFQGENTIHLDVSALSSGTYYLDYSTNEGKANRRIIVLK